MMSRLFHVLLLSLAVCAYPGQESASPQDSPAGDQGLLDTIFKPLAKLSETANSLKSAILGPFSLPPVPGLGKAVDEAANKPEASAASKGAEGVKTLETGAASTKEAKSADAEVSTKAAEAPADAAKTAAPAVAAKEPETADAVSAKSAAPAEPELTTPKA